MEDQFSGGPAQPAPVLLQTLPKFEQRPVGDANPVLEALSPGDRTDRPLTAIIQAAREKVSREITDQDAFLVDASHVTVDEISRWARSGAKATT